MRLLLVCNPGGHFATMMGLKEFWSAHYREWVTYPKFDTERLRRQEIVLKGHKLFPYVHQLLPIG